MATICRIMCGLQEDTSISTYSMTSVLWTSMKTKKKILSDLTYSYHLKTGVKATTESIDKLSNKIIRSIPLFLIKDLDTDEAWSRKQKFNVSRVLIRAEGTQNNKTGFYKTLLDKDLDYKARDPEEVVYLDTITLWKPGSKVFLKLFVDTYDSFFKPKGISRPKTRDLSKPYSSSYIDKLLENPIKDERHRVVGQILAPYLVNVKGFSETDAISEISEYISRCRALKETSVNEAYISYQVRYAKRRGLMPLSYSISKKRTPRRSEGCDRLKW